MHSKTLRNLVILCNIFKLTSGTQYSFPPPIPQYPQSYSFSQNLNHLPLPPPVQVSSTSSKTSPNFLSQRRLTRQESSSSTQNSPQTPIYPVITGGQNSGSILNHPSYDLFHHSQISPSGNAETNALLLDFLYDYYEYGQGPQQQPLLPHIPPDYGWIYPPSPPPTTVPETHPVVTQPSISMPPYKPFKPFKPKPPPLPPPNHHHKPKPGKGKDTDNDTTDEDSNMTDEDDEDKRPDTQPPILPIPSSLFQFGFWRPPSISEGHEEYKTKFERLKEKWNRLLDRLKINTANHPPSPEGEKESEIVHRRPIKWSGSSGGGYPISSSPSMTKFHLEQLPGWNTPPLRNPSGQSQRYPQVSTPIRQPVGIGGSSSNYNNNYNNYYGWVPLPPTNKRPDIAYPAVGSSYYSPYNKYYTK